MYEILVDRSVIEVVGEDVVRFLQNLTTNDVEINDYCYSYMLNNQGRYLFDFFIYKISETEFFIDLNNSQSNLFKTYLEMYKLRAKVKVNDLSKVYQIVYSKKEPQFNNIISKKDPRYNLLGFRSVVNKQEKQITEKKELYLQDKYNFAIVDGYMDLIYNKSLPIEYGAEELNAINYNKGCYVGQEVISRTKYQGIVRKKIFKLSANIDLSYLSKKDDIITNNIKIGIVCSSYANNAIALVREEQYLAVQDSIMTVRDIPVFLSLPPWYN